MSRYLAVPLLLLAVACKKKANAITEPQVLSCAATDVTGRLTRSANGPAFVYTTQAGWKIAIDSIRIRITPVSPISYYELWGSSHENLSGKHIKDLLQTRRSLELDGGTLITIAAETVPPNATGSGMEWIRWISIYDGNETHRISVNGGKPSLTRSCALTRFEETLEYDGETGRLSETQGGLRFENIYTQGESAGGIPLDKIPQLVPLGQTNYSIPGQVNDFFDDPRLNAT
jgi:hypothetical protein